MSWTLGAVDNYTLIYDNASGYRVDRDRLGYLHPLYDPEKEKHHGWWYRSHSSSLRTSHTSSLGLGQFFFVFCIKASY